MQDKFIIATKVKITIEYIEKTVTNFPHTENNLKNKIINECYELLETIYLANTNKEIKEMKTIYVKLKMIDYLLKRSYDKRLIGIKKYETIANYLLEINKMITAWLNNEKIK